MYRVAFLGPEGTHSHRAVIAVFGESVKQLRCNQFDDVFKYVESKQADFAVIPLENNTAGVVDTTLDLLIQSPLQIVAEFTMEIKHSLLSLEGKLSKINKLYSLSQPFFQSHQFVKAHLPEAQWIQSASSSQALQECLENPIGSAAIGDALTGQKYRTELIKREYTRF